MELECLRVFTRFPQTVKVFFGGAHDNGYTSTLTLLQNEGLLDKVILLKGYKDLAHEINSLSLPQLEIEGVFIQKKLHTNPGSKKVATQTAGASSNTATSTPKSNNSPKPNPASVQPQEHEKVRLVKASAPDASGASPVVPVGRSRQLDLSQVLPTLS